MLQFNRWQTTFMLLIVLAGAYFTVPNFFAQDETPPGFMETRITLGLDLQGGSYLLLEVDTQKVLDDRLNNLLGDIRSELRGGAAAGGDRITFSGPNREGDTIIVDIRDEAQVDEALDRLRRLSTPLGGPLGGGFGRNLSVERDGASITLELTQEAREFYASAAVEDSMEVVRRRIDALGTREPMIMKQGDNRLVVQVPGDNDSEALKDVINRTGQLSFHMVDPTVSLADAQNGLLPPRRIMLPTEDDPSPFLVLEETPVITGDMVQTASAGPDQDSAGSFQINFSFDSRGARRFAETTRQNVGERFAIVLDDRIISAPNIISPIIGGSGRITGNFSAQESNDLAVLIRSGALPAPLQTIEQRTVGAGLGADSVKAGAEALILGFILVVIYMGVYYGRFGIYADIALIANVLMIAGALSLLGSTLTLPGIAGIVLTIGMAVDANVLIFERIREEVAAGKKAVQAVEAGYSKALSAIIDANITTFIAAAVMFYLGSGPVRGFSVTLAIGVVTSVFSAYFLTRLMAGRHVLANRNKQLSL
ncbi:protein translocase subunit SecD [Aquisalinus flavus]|uniref:Protein translocase subunit SecD n=1 Tax=Aquisalinus flavus TaxID=1526572 RepID=A0A8J2V5H3_9PROT|nr:protein translocase subunit SecD [Aquisalinus flavus]MBD0427570.1 protein translocase subunit SecD [Aquisalinus flavus]UNE47362.1 protein translocase subunit SecD [Aquisalinus flavus]GGD02000.1 hypothetical protein GCM10011342_08830 [Aquisalinus flavus]